MFEQTRLANVREKLLGIVAECWKVGELTAREFETAKRLINVGEGEEGINALNNVDDPLLVERLQMERKLEYLLDDAEGMRKLYEHTVQTAEQKLVEAYCHWWRRVEGALHRRRGISRTPSRFYGYGAGTGKRIGLYARGKTVSLSELPGR